MAKFINRASKMMNASFSEEEWNILTCILGRVDIDTINDIRKVFQNNNVKLNKDFDVCKLSNFLYENSNFYNKK